MAKKTKDSNLSLEERLEQALIPNWDEPYKLPPNWCWAKFLCCSNIRTGKKDANYGSEDGEYPFFTCAADPIRCDGYSFDCHAILLAGNGDIGNISIYDGKFEAYQRTYVVETVGDIDTRYAYYYFKYKWEDYNKDKMFGTAIPYIRLGNLQDFPFPIAPMSEQERIVKQIESLFEKLDEAKEKAKEVVDGFETRKAAILHKAFSGELTAKWREEHQHSIHKWSNWSIDELCFSLKYGTAKKSKSEGPVVVIRMGNLQQGEIDWTDLAYTDDPEDIEKYKLFPGDVLFNRTNSAALVGKTSIYRGEYPAIFAGYLIKLDYDRNNIIGDYLNYALNTTTAKEYCNSVKTDGVNQSNINAKKIGAFVIPVAPIKEQEEIVRIIKELWRKEKAAKDAAESVIEQIDAMKKAILARAFRGELGTNDLSEEGALELLKSVLMGNTNQQEPQKSSKKSISIPNHIETALLTKLEKKIVSLFYTTERKVVSVDEIMSVSSKKIDIIDTLTKLEQRGIIIRLNNSCYRIKE